MYYAFEQLHRKLRSEHSDLTDYEWLKLTDLASIPHWLYGLQGVVTYNAINFAFYVQDSKDASCWQYVNVNQHAGFWICSPYYSARKRPSLAHFRQWAVR